jgi:hypothetical protein
MNIEQIFAKERDRYVQQFVETRSKLTSSSESTVGELLIRINNEAIPLPYGYLRVDVMCYLPNETHKPYEVAIDFDQSFESKGFNFGDFVVEVYPFTWSSVQILVNHPIENTRQLEGWITRWLDVEDKNPSHPLGISQAIHSFSPVARIDEWWSTTGDFGTAAADALVEFVELMAGQGMTRIIIKSGNVNI